VTGKEPFVWDVTHGMRGLVALLEAQGVDLTGWKLREATGVSANGLRIVGNGTNPAGKTEAWIAVLDDNSPSVPVAQWWIRGFAEIGFAAIARIQLARSTRPPGTHLYARTE